MLKTEQFKQYVIAVTKKKCFLAEAKPDQMTNAKSWIFIDSTIYRNSFEIVFPEIHPGFCIEGFPNVCL